jgi:hypothetical protein
MSKEAARPVPAVRTWHDVAQELLNEHEPGKKSELLEELARILQNHNEEPAA